MRRLTITVQTVLVIAVGLTLTASWTLASLVGRPAPEITNQTWINSSPLTLADLHGKVVFLQFWTYG